MPLVTIVGFPCSGKTSAGQRLADYFGGLLDAAQEDSLPIKRIELISDSDQLESHGGRNKVYASSAIEKEVRGWIKSGAMRHMARDTLVILDAANYIKGYRYELYCAAKEYKSTHCILEMVVNKDAAWEWNCSRSESERYTREIFDALLMRYEAPDSRNRWDTPLISSSAWPLSDETVEAVRQALFSRTVSKPNLCTVQQPLAGGDYLFQLDAASQTVVKRILTVQATQQLSGSAIKMPNCDEPLHLPRNVPAGELNRLRRQFINYSKLHPVPQEDIVRQFIHYLNNTVSV